MKPIAGKMSDIYGKKKDTTDRLVDLFCWHSCRRIYKQHRIHAFGEGGARCRVVNVPDSLGNHQRTPPKEETSNRTNNFQFDVFWRALLGLVVGQFPTQDAYNLIFLTAALIAVTSIASRCR
jgi:hypothetical protein